jgi:hypothetical protein
MKRTLRLILGPLTISAAMTLLRLLGELEHWSPRWFASQTGGLTPTGTTWLFGMSWLPVFFGPYFVDRLRKTESSPNALKVFLLGATGGGLVLLGNRFVLPLIPLPFPQFLLGVWAVMATGATLQAWGWPPLFRALLLYGLGSRAIVAFVMLFAMIGNWGTHYDYVGMPPEFQMPLVPRFLWLALFPQLIFWVGFTIILGSLCAGLYGLVRPLERRSGGAPSVPESPGR